MTNFVGMDVVEIREVAKRFDANAAQLGGVIGRVDQLLVRMSGAWHGDDSANFRRQWTVRYRGQLQTTQAALTELARAATRNAAEQDQTSAADPGVTGIGSGPTGPPATGSGNPGIAELEQDLTYIKLVDAAGSGSEHPTLPPGYEKVSNDDLKTLGLTGYKTNGITGMDVSVYRDADGHYVVAFPGSSTGVSSIRALWNSGMDWGVNDVSGIAGISLQEQQAVQIARAITSHVGVDNVTFTGHSLGGQSAALAALCSGSQAVTFNAAAITPLVADRPGVREEAAGLITNYQTSEDPLSNSQKYLLGNGSVGTVVQVPGTGNAFELGANHSTPAIEAGIRTLIDKAEREQ